MAEKIKEKSSEEKLLRMLHGQLTSAYATGGFGVKDYEKKLSALAEKSSGKVLGVKGQIIGGRQERLLRVCNLIDEATMELEGLIALY